MAGKNIFKTNPEEGLEQVAGCIGTMESLWTTEGEGALTNEQYDDAEEACLDLMDAARSAGFEHKRLAAFRTRYLRLQQLSSDVPVCAGFEPLEKIKEMNRYESELVISRHNEESAELFEVADTDLRKIEKL